MEEKNIWVLPTNKPSRLWINDITGKIELSHSSDVYGALNIYITSDEEIKEGDWYLDLSVFTNNISIGRGIYQMKYSKWGEEGQGDCKKIILTTDQDLIKDGVQSIDEEFIQWFVKNSDCEYVEIVKNLTTSCECYYTKHCISTQLPINKHCREVQSKVLYKIILPQEEPKQELLKQYPLTPEECFKQDPKQQNYIKSETFVVGMGYTLEDGSTKFVSKQEHTPKSCDIIFDTAAFIDDEEAIEQAGEKWSLSSAKEFALNYFKKSDEVPSKRIFTYELLLRILEAGIECGYKFGTKSDTARDYWYEKFQNEVEDKTLHAMISIMQEYSIIDEASVLQFHKEWIEQNKNK